jgi:hypothetical protein
MSRRAAWIIFLLSAGCFVLFGFALERAAPYPFSDFKLVYYSTKCLLQRCDPYNINQLQSFYEINGWNVQSYTLVVREAWVYCIYPPTTFIMIVPFTLLNWHTAHTLWAALVAGFFILSSLLMWKTAANYSPGISLLLVCLVLLNAELLFATGNAAGLVLGLCIIAAWCLVNERFIPFGILCLAVSLALKPHDAGFVWLFFLLSGGIHRKRALRVLAIVGALGLAAIMWASLVAPHWLHELHFNLVAEGLPGGPSDPTPGDRTVGRAIGIVDLQTITSMFSNNPRIYNLVSYVVCGTLLIVWAVKTLRSPFSKEKAWFALAVIAPLTLLPTYHREYDAKLLLLTIPACAILWSEKGAVRWIALLLNTAAILFAGDLSLSAFMVFTRGLHPSATGLPVKMLDIPLTRPVPLFLLILSLFYLWIYVRRFAGRAYEVSHESSSLASSKLPPAPAEVPAAVHPS